MDILVLGPVDNLLFYSNFRDVTIKLHFMENPERTCTTYGRGRPRPCSAIVCALFALSIVWQSPLLICL